MGIMDFPNAKGLQKKASAIKQTVSAGAIGRSVSPGAIGQTVSTVAMKQTVSTGATGRTVSGVALGQTVSTVGTGIRLHGENLNSPAPNQPVKKASPLPASDIRNLLTAEENARFLHLISACARITTHYELFLLVQDELQYFLPHDILIAAWGNFGEQDPQFDVISSLPGVRTNRVCNIVVPLAKRLHQLWGDGGHRPMVMNQSVATLQTCSHDACGGPCAFPDMTSTLVHGACNRRDGYDSLYIALRRRPFATNGTEARLPFVADAVIHQLDVAYRKVAALETGKTPSNERAPSPLSTLSSLLSTREVEITHWVCEGKTNAQIAHILGISVNTVKNHVHRIFDKLGADNRTHAVVKYRGMSAREESSLAGSDG